MPASGAGGRRFESDQPHVNLYILFSPTSVYNIKRMLASSEDKNLNVTTPYYIFKYSIRSELTRRYYERRIKKFFDYIGFLPGSELEKQCNVFAKKATRNNNWAVVNIIRFLQYEKARVEKGEITAATLSNFVKSIKLYCEMCDITIHWKKITRGLPRPRLAANDRAPTIDEIRQLIEYPDRRIKPIIYTMVSSGIRLGAWDYLKWKHITPLTSESGTLLGAQILVYAGDSEEYYAFATPEAFNSLKTWMEFRSNYGEKITGDSWLMRDIWQTSNMKYGAKFGLATNPKKLKSSGIKRLIEQALWEQGIRSKLQEGVKRHEWKAVHGFRKFYKTRAEQVMKPINVEITMGHNIGLSGSYYRPTEREILDDYLMAVDLLTINEENRLKNKVEKLEIEKSRIDLMSSQIEEIQKTMARSR